MEKAIAYGADILMLPMVLTRQEVEQYVAYVRGRARVCIMVETAQALARLDEILNVRGVDEIFVGLNDLHISMGLSFMFELLSGGLVEYVANKCKKRGMPFGFGGIARIGDGILPAERILAEHVFLGSSSVILSRTFKGEAENDLGRKIDLKEEVGKVRECMAEMSQWNNGDFENNRKAIVEIVRNIVG